MQFMSRSIRFLASFTAIAMLAAGVFAQETTGGLQGTVKDGSGALVSSAQVEVTGIPRRQENGDDRFCGILPIRESSARTYTIDVSAKGFKGVRRAGLELQVVTSHS